MKPKNIKDCMLIGKRSLRLILIHRRGVERWFSLQGILCMLGPLKDAIVSYLCPIICVDGCWLKGTYGGQLLSAVTVDPNDMIFPLA